MTTDRYSQDCISAPGFLCLEDVEKPDCLEKEEAFTSGGGENMECEDCGATLTVYSACLMTVNDDDLILCQECHDDRHECPCGCHNDVLKCVYSTPGEKEQELADRQIKLAQDFINDMAK